MRYTFKETDRFNKVYRYYPVKKSEFLTMSKNYNWVTDYKKNLVLPIKSINASVGVSAACFAMSRIIDCSFFYPKSEFRKFFKGFHLFASPNLYNNNIVFVSEEKDLVLRVGMFLGKAEIKVYSFDGFFSSTNIRQKEYATYVEDWDITFPQFLKSLRLVYA